MRFRFGVFHNFDVTVDELRDLRESLNFSQVVLEALNDIQREQRQRAPIGKSGLRRIPKSIATGRVTQTGNKWSGTSFTDYGPAIFTNEGTGSHGGGGSYELREPDIMHPGIKGTEWFGDGFFVGAERGYEKLVRKVERAMGV